MTDYETLSVETPQPGVVVITLNRPKAANGLNPQLCEELLRAARSCDGNPDVKAVILTGAGRFFCAGGDITAFASDLDAVGQTVKGLANDLHMAISTFARMDAPVITAVNGIAAGAGFSLAAIGDIAIASDKAAFLMAYTKSGFSPDGSASYFLPRLIGLRRTQELMLTNRQLSAEEARDWGVVTEVAPHDNLMARALELADMFAKGARGSNAMVKQLLLSTFDNGLETQMEIEGRGIAACAASPDGLEGIQAFLEKRAPKFR